MAPVKQKPVHPSHKKRHGTHHNKGKQYVSVYWPYIPIITLMVMGLGLLLPGNKTATLGYATNMSNQTLLSATNAQRLKDGDKELKINDQLSAAATAKAKDMADRDYWSHTTPEGSEPWVFIESSGYAYEKAGENLAYGFSGSSETINGWMNSPTHRKNMLDGAYSEVGFGFVDANNYQGQDKETIVVAMYGRPALTTTTQPQEATYATTSAPISRLQAFTAGRAPWLTFTIGLMSGLAVTFLVLRHGFALRKLALEGEHFLTHHPVLDVALLVIVATGLYLGRTTGFIV